MSHSDTIKELPEGFELLGTTESIPVAAFKKTTDNRQQTTDNHPLYGLQFHLEVYHSAEGKTILRNFLVNICGCSQDWTPAHFITDTVEALKTRLVIKSDYGPAYVFDSTVAATLINKKLRLAKTLMGHICG